MKKNIKLFNIYIFLYQLEMWIPVQVLLLLDKGFSLSQVAFLDAMWYLSTVIFEVPTGTITDRFGKKASFFIAAIIKAISLLLLVIGKTFLTICAAEILWGFSSSFETGTTDAFLFDSLKQVNREDEFRRIRARVTTLSILAAALGSLIAGYFGKIQIGLPITITAIIALLVCPIIFLFKEPEDTTPKEPSFILHIRESFGYIFNHRRVASLIFYSSVMGAGIWAMHLFYQPLLRSYGIGVDKIGAFYLFFRLSAATGAFSSDRLYKNIGEVSLFIIPLCFIVSVLALGLFSTPWVLGVILIIFFINGLYFPILRDLLNQNIPSGKRATIISTGAMLSCLISTVINPLLGWISDTFSLQLSFNVLGFGTLVAMSIILISLRRRIQPLPEIT